MIAQMKMYSCPRTEFIHLKKRELTSYVALAESGLFDFSDSANHAVIKLDSNVETAKAQDFE